MQIFIAEIIVHYHYLSLLQYSNKDCLLRPEDCLETVHKQFFLSAVSGVSVFCQQSIAFLFSYWLGTLLIIICWKHFQPIRSTLNNNLSKKMKNGMECNCGFERQVSQEQQKRKCSHCLVSYRCHLSWRTSYLHDKFRLQIELDQSKVFWT